MYQTLSFLENVSRAHHNTALVREMNNVSQNGFSHRNAAHKLKSPDELTLLPNLEEGSRLRIEATRGSQEG